ncbi:MULTISPECIES: acyl-homoserine-lactone synthase [unclassified Azospirillum]|uniref:acyl-homoserine-lactone synthase n=1 Tax=unclassified Azospirillum TaxID=2630922 RepID=UPI0013597157|nr:MULTISPECIES: acyl-homoserine-lactone synthase [unclassified Azospirillum]
MHSLIEVDKKISSISHAVVFTAQSHTDLVWRIQELRRRIFVEHLGWPLSVDGDRERDQFDRKDTIYGAVVENAVPVACWRLLPTDKPYLLADVFPHLTDGESLPHSNSVWEISRFGVDPDHPAPNLMTRELLGLMMRFAVSRRIETIVAVTDAAFQRVLARNGLTMFRYAGFEEVGGGARGPIIAGGLHVAEQTNPRYRKILAPLKEAA